MVNRRSFIQLTTVATAATFTSQTSGAEALEPLPEDNPQAVALKYVEDVSASAPEGYPAGSGQDCANCLHYESLDDTWGSCALFPGYKVRAAGWCVGWVKQS